MIVTYSYVGGPLDGQTIRAREDAALTRSAAGLPLPASVGDRGVKQLNQRQEPEPVYIRMRGTYTWLPGLAAQRRAEIEARQERERRELAAEPARQAEIEVQAQMTRVAYLRAQAEHEQACARCGLDSASRRATS